MSMAPDITIYAPDRGVLLVAEVKTGKSITADWAVDYRSHIVEHMPIVQTAPYFLIAAPTQFFFWCQGRATDAPPDYATDSAPLLAAVVDIRRVDLETITQPSLQMLVETWLRVIPRSRQNGRSPDPGQAWLVESGLLDTIKGGSVLAEAA